MCWHACWLARTPTYCQRDASQRYAQDLVQAGCGLSLPRRGVGAFFLLRPAMATFDALLAFTATFSPHHLRHYSEQTAINCFFANRSRTLPCDFLFDVASPAARYRTPSSL